MDPASLPSAAENNYLSIESTESVVMSNFEEQKEERSSRLFRRQSRVPALFLALGVYFLAHFLSQSYTGIQFSYFSLHCDICLFLVVSEALRVTSRTTIGFLFLESIWAALAHLPHVIKLQILGLPVFPEDVFVVPTLFTVLEGPLYVLAVIFIAMAAIAAALCIRRSLFHLSSLLITGLLTLLIFFPSFVTTADYVLFGQTFWSPIVEYKHHGPLAFLFFQSARFRKDSLVIPSKEKVESIVRVTGTPPSQNPLLPLTLRRNIHLILIEALWDPSPILTTQEQDPFDPRFRALLTAAEGSSLLSPVFGGGTANAELELLCGIPSIWPRFAFLENTSNALPCLPQLLTEIGGYESAAFHPNEEIVWRRDRAYKQMGFSQFFSSPFFDYDDLNGPFLSDASLLKQVIGSLEKENKEVPRFNYVLSISSHFAFPLSPSRPQLFHFSDNEIVNRYAHVVWYSTKEVMDHIEEVRAQDPNAIIVVAGDHLPTFGEELKTFSQSGFLAPESEKVTPVQLIRYTRTPLLVINGQKGVVKTGELPMYEFPRLLLNLLGMPDISLSRYFTSLLPGEHIRPIEEKLLVMGNHPPLDCQIQDQRALCQLYVSWDNQRKVLYQDLIQGEQHLLRFRDDKKL